MTSGLLRRMSYLALAGCVLLAQSAAAQEMGSGGGIITGKGEFLAHCASCHGADGKGDGPVAPALAVKPADLTQLAKSNGGTFPAKRVFNSIDGTTQVAAHGTKAAAGNTPMPVWGLAFRSSAESGSGANFTPQEVNKRIKLIVDYIKSIQAQ